MQNIFDTKGTFRNQRLLKALNNEYLRLDDRSFVDLLKESAELAAKINFYNDENKLEGTWKEFFEKVYDYENKQVKKDVIEKLQEKSDTPPHLALLFAFYKIFGFAQDEFNYLNKRHLDYYYFNILKFNLKPENLDEVNLFIEPKKNVNDFIIEKNTLFDAGKDKDGKSLFYSSIYDLVVNQSKVKEIKTISYTSKNNVLDILYNGKSLQEENKDFGFAISSPLFYLEEGRRRVTICFYKNQQINYFKTCCKIEYTSETGWELVDFKITKNYLLINIPKNKPPVCKYDETIHLGSINAKYPVVKITLIKGKNIPASIITSFNNLKPSSIKNIIVNVEGAKNLLLYNDLGKLNSNKPFFPFGVNPEYNSSEFIIGNNKIFNKYLKSFDFSINWKGLPFNIGNYYESYKNRSFLFNAKEKSLYRNFSIEKFKNDFSEGHPPGRVYILKDGIWRELINNEYSNYRKNKRAQNRKYKGKVNKYYVDHKKFYNNKYKINKSDFSLSLDNDSIQKNLNEYNYQSKEGFVKIVSSYDYGHKIYPELLRKVLLANTYKASSALIKFEKNDSDNSNLNFKQYEAPKEPYTPEFKDFAINYRLSDNFNLQNHQIFFINPFNNCEVKDFSKKITNDFQIGKYVYIGFEGITRPLELNFYIELNNKIVDTYNINDKTEIKWSYLSNNLNNKNEWINFEEKQIASDSTNNLTKSGVISFILPKNAIPKNSSNDDKEDLVWLRLAILKNQDVYNVKTVRTNCLIARFINNNNDLSHLNKGLPKDTITKLVKRNDKVEKVSQPYYSYGGKPKESIESFYTRVSERLRHKNRALSKLDYEQLILENFPKVLYVRCLTNCDKNYNFSPGSIHILVCPDTKIVKQSQESENKPRFQLKELTEIANYLKEIVSPHVDINISNFHYKEIKVNCKLKLKKKYSDYLLYREKLNKDINKFLTPWIYGSDNLEDYIEEDPKNVSDLFFYLENIEYVDYIISAFLFIEGKKITLSDNFINVEPNVLFTTARNHIIQIEE